MFVNKIDSCRGIVAICDSEILGKYFDEGILQLDIKESFYKGKEVSEQELREIMEDMIREDATFNIVGKKSIKVALEVGLITDESIGYVKGIPFALVLL